MPFENRNPILHLKMKNVGVYAKYQKCETNESKHYPIRHLLAKAKQKNRLGGGGGGGGGWALYCKIPAYKIPVIFWCYI